TQRRRPFLGMRARAGNSRPRAAADLANCITIVALSSVFWWVTPSSEKASGGFRIATTEDGRMPSFCGSDRFGRRGAMVVFGGFFTARSIAARTFDQGVYTASGRI